ncbi:NUDIX hydrolase [Telluribacter sp.]|jgi:8-oxo-dGTP pyrophosphatase MutT (NUDIX family)|uniref:NUDIX hydrolase n=1 Tax=Telluribacter sp. TaxID=1978767 RepID=UPI002E142993|nr:NUDIX hydrolase [Telluribacter sp.]
MQRDWLLSRLEEYTPLDENEREMCLSTKRFIRTQPDCFERTLAIGHVTGSAWVVSPDRAQVLLMHHRKLDRWFQPGGHCDGDPQVLEVAMKEATEETGLRQITPVSDQIFDVDVHLIPANSKEAAHYHYDIRFLLEADPNQPIERNAESKEVRWISLDKVAEYNNSESILRMVRKLQQIAAP